MILAEVYRVIYEGPDDKLRGIIVSHDKENGYQYLFKDQDLDVDINDIMQKYNTVEAYMDAEKKLDLDSKPLIRAADHIKLIGPNQSSIRAEDGFSMRFYMFNGVIYDDIPFEYPYDPRRMLSAPLTEVLLSEDGTRYLSVFYAVFGDAAEAHIKITFTKKNSDAFDLRGIISARTSAINYPAYSSLIFYKEQGEKIKVGDGHETSIPLSRPIVAVPLGSQLILDFGLFCDDDKMVVEDDDNMIVQTSLIYEVKGTGETTPIKCSKGDFIVEVTWRYERNPLETSAQAN